MKSTEYVESNSRVLAARTLKTAESFKIWLVVVGYVLDFGIGGHTMHQRRKR